MEEIIQQLLEEQKKTNEYLKANEERQEKILIYLEDKVLRECTGKNPYEMLTREQAMKEFPMGNVNTSLKVFKHKDFQAQRYTKPWTVQRKAIYKWYGKSHDDLCDK